MATDEAREQCGKFIKGCVHQDVRRFMDDFHRLRYAYTVVGSEQEPPPAGPRSYGPHEFEGTGFRCVLCGQIRDAEIHQ